MVVDLPFLFSDIGKAQRMLDGPVGARLMGELPTKGVYGLSYGWWGWRVVDAVSKAVPEPGDMQGVKIRVQPGAIYAAMFTTLKAIPVQIDLSEVYLALSQNTVGAVEVPIISVVANKYDEVVKVITNTDHVYNTGVMMASKRNLDTLDKKYQERHSPGRRGDDPGLAQDGRRFLGAGREEPCREGRQVGRGRPGRPIARPWSRSISNTARLSAPDLMDAVLKAAA